MTAKTGTKRPAAAAEGQPEHVPERYRRPLRVDGGFLAYAGGLEVRPIVRGLCEAIDKRHGAIWERAGQLQDTVKRLAREREDLPNQTDPFSAGIAWRDRRLAAWRDEAALRRDLAELAENIVAAAKERLVELESEKREAAFKIEASLTKSGADSRSISREMVSRAPAVREVEARISAVRGMSSVWVQATRESARADDVDKTIGRAVEGFLQVLLGER